MQSLLKLKSIENKFKSVIISRDMTKTGREHCKILVEEAEEKSRNETGTSLTESGVPGYDSI